MANKPQVLVVYYTFTEQTRRVADAMTASLTACGCNVAEAAIAFTDPNWANRFSELPMRSPVAIRIASILIAQRTRRTGQIVIPPEAESGNYDLVLICSPTWWLTTSMPIRSYLESAAAARVMSGRPFAAASISRRYWKGNVGDIRRIGERNGGIWVGETHFTAAGNQVASMLSWLSYVKHGEPRERLLGLKLPAPNLQPGYGEAARAFAERALDQALDARAGTERGC